MKKYIGVVLSLAAVAALSSCGPSLGEYVALSSTYKSTIASTARVRVDIEPADVVSSGGNDTFALIGSLVNTASAISSVAISADQQDRLARIVDTETMVQNVAAGFDSGFVGATHMQSVPDATAPDIRIMLQIRSYGLWAESLASSMKFFVEADVKVIYTPEMKTVYSTGVSLMREASAVIDAVSRAAAGHVVVTVDAMTYGRQPARIAGDVANLAVGAANLTAFFKLTDDDVSTAFYYMAIDAGQYIAAKLVSAIYR